jgi:glycosyltransferase involved in cell wall biosynthesis
MKTKVCIDPSIGIWYSSFYIKGLQDRFGKENVLFSAKYFNNLERKKDPYSFDKHLPFVVVSSNSMVQKFIIDFGDSSLVSEIAYKWCDKYAKVNFNLEKTEKKYLEKMISIPPGFGIKIWNFFETAYYCFSNYILIQFKSSPLVNLKTHLIDYFRQFRRDSIEDYVNSSVLLNSNKKPYVFLIANLWHHKNCLEETNLFRKAFIEACKTSNCDFEGGFSSVEKDHPQREEFKNLFLKKRYPINEYIKKTKLSAIVFNTPSVHNCHGWKLGEYFAMGKAIISTTLSNNLPEELVHGKNIHFISNISELKIAINFLLDNSGYRMILEQGAKEYYSKFVSPQKVIESILA